MTSSERHDEAIQLFLRQHAMLHSARMAQTGLWSFEDEVLDDMSEEQIRRIPHNCEHSVAWAIWHIARIEDVTIFESSVSPGHMWHPQGGDYKVLWKGVVEGTLSPPDKEGKR